MGRTKVEGLAQCGQVNAIEKHIDRKGSNMVIRWILFDTKAGELLLVLLERRAGLAVVQSAWLAVQHSGEPRAASGQ